MSGLVVVVGSVNVDLVAQVARHPRPGETVTGSDLTRRHGGKGANQAVAAAGAGARVAFVGRVGDDADGRDARAALEAAGVDTRALRVDPRSTTGTAMIVVDGVGENTIVVSPGANATVDRDDVEDAGGLIDAADAVLVPLEIGDDAVDEVVERCRRNGTRLVLNASPVRDLPDSWLATADPAVVNEHEAAALGLDPTSACVTLGAGGARWGTASATPPPVDVVDTTGAGDAFAGTLAAALAAGESNASALDRAVEAGARATTWHGARRA